MYLHSTLMILSISMLFCMVSAFSTDKLSLLEFKAKINEDGPMDLLREWNESKHFCSWSGITCGRRHRDRVTVLDMTGWRVKGQLSPHVGNLSFLRRLSISNNSFGGEIPQEIGRLFRLQKLDLRLNSFGGEIPGNISGCLSLKFFAAYHNNIGGRIPAELGSLPELRFISLSANKLVGEIPIAFGNLSRLKEIYLSHNGLSGTIPASLGGLKNLKFFAVGSNYFKGNIPPSLYNVSTLQDFVVEVNNLEGNLPPNFGITLPNLRNVYFRKNNFSGNIPATMTNASNLYHFSVSHNNFRGNVPSFKSSTNLQRLVLSANNLGYAASGDLNFLRDTINYTSLSSVTLATNNFGGEIPENIGNATWLRQLAFGTNEISGNIPLGIGDLANLEVLGMESNNLIGQIPSTIGKLKRLYFLELSGNQLSGNIPTTIGNLTLLSILNLLENNIQGSIPESLGKCQNLEKLSLNSNNLSGPIPSQLFSLTSLSIRLDLSDNHLSGSIPSEVGKLVNLARLDFSKNELSGEIPASLGSCRSMEYLYLQGNIFRGRIPDDLRKLKGVQVMDISRNELSGRIPIFFSEFRGFTYLNLSFNKLEGPVPLAGVFKKASKFSIAGNTELCGGILEVKLPNCVSGLPKNYHKLSPKTMLIVITSCALVGLIVVIVVVFFLQKRKRKPTMEQSVGISLPRVSYGDLAQATNNFSSSNLIGMGSFGSVYKGFLSQENKFVAVKVLDLQVLRALKSFLAECKSLGSVRHRNLVKLLTVCSSVDFQGNDFKALVYEFMENGNLEEWLYKEQHLSLLQRIKIAINVATALDYLHNNCFEPIIHCDIKPSNILLDGNMVAHLGDFGLAKLLRCSVSNESSSIGVIRGTIGYVPPEYATASEVSTSGDIYSFGVLLLEMFTGKRPTDNMFKDDFDLNKFASSTITNRISSIVDPMILDEEQDQDVNVIRSLVSLIELGVACSSKHPTERRTISEVAAELHKIKDVLIRIMTRNRVYTI